MVFFFYPALAVPIEGKAEFVCHESHIEKAESFLRTCSDFLIIGFSALDEHVLELLKVVREVKKLTVVNGNKQSGDEALGRISEMNSKFSPQSCAYEPVFDGGFGNFMDNQELRRLLSEVWFVKGSDS